MCLPSKGLAVQVPDVDMGVVIVLDSITNVVSAQHILNFRSIHLDQEPHGTQRAPFSYKITQPYYVSAWHYHYPLHHFDG
jgi:hypothetical protein